MGLDTKTYWPNDLQSQSDFDFDLEESLETAVRRVEISRLPPDSKDVYTEDEEAKAFEAVTRRQPVKLL
jgi:hypothetical protein